MVSPRPHRVAVLVLPTVIPLELGIVTEVFGRDPHYDVTVCAQRRTSAVSGSGFTINVSAGIQALDQAETVIVPGYDDVDGTVSTIALDALRAAHARRARLVSICTGAFALAATGLLDGRPATTHWRWSARTPDPAPPRERPVEPPVRRRRRHPHVRRGHDRDRPVPPHHPARPRRRRGQQSGTRARRSTTAPRRASAVRRTIAPGVERRPTRRPSRLDAQEPRPPARPRHASPPRHTCPDEHSPAGFAKRPDCLQWLGSPTPASTAPRELLETTTEPVENIGRLTGLGAPASVRAAFHRRLGISPQDYRSLFRHRTPTSISGDVVVRV